MPTTNALGSLPQLAMTESPLSTPKRKRNEMLIDDIPKLNTTTQFTFDLFSALDDGNASPRTRVARQFHAMGLSTVGNATEDGARKRIKMPDVEMRDAGCSIIAAESVDSAEKTTANADLQPPHILNMDGSPTRRQRSPKSLRFALDATVTGQSETSPNTDANYTNPSTNTTPSPPSSPSHRKSPQPRNQRPLNKRSGTPPFAPGPKATPSSPDEQPTITDPLRASLTWHDDEITIYDPDDSDDDGTGINGIGFKPTPAIAYERTVRRRQQLAEYRKREEREARAKRSQRRRGGASPGPKAAGLGLKGKGRRVRFLEGGMTGERERLVGV